MFDRQLAFIDDMPNLINISFRQAIHENGGVIESYITQRQLPKGLDGKGVKLREYKEVYKRVRAYKGLQTENTDLKVTGSFYASVEVESDDVGFTVRSGVSFGKYLVDKSESYYAYGFDILRPSAENMKEFFETYVASEIKRRSHGLK